jgi:hypothetical protein
MRKAVVQAQTWVLFWVYMMLDMISFFKSEDIDNNVNNVICSVKKGGR